MSLRGLFALIAVSDIVAWGGWYVLLTATGPDSGLAIIMTFYASLFIALTGLFALIGLLIRLVFYKQEDVIQLFAVRTFRQAFFLAFLIIISLWLAHNEWLRWWVLLLVIAAVATWEHFFLTGEEA